MVGPGTSVGVKVGVGAGGGLRVGLLLGQLVGARGMKRASWGLRWPPPQAVSTNSMRAVNLVFMGFLGRLNIVKKS